MITLMASWYKVLRLSVGVGNMGMAQDNHVQKVHAAIFNALFRDTPLGYGFCTQPNSQIAKLAKYLDIFGGSPYLLAPLVKSNKQKLKKSFFFRDTLVIMV